MQLDRRSPRGDGRSKSLRRRLRRDRLTTLAATSALLLVVALVAVPIAVDSLFEDPKESVWGPSQPAGRPAGRADDDALHAVNTILAPGVDAPKPQVSTMAKRLGALGPNAIPVVVGMLCGEIESPQFEEGSLDQPIHPEALARREQALFASVCHFSSKDVVAQLQSRIEESPYEVRLVLARLLGEVATLEAQAALLELLGKLEPEQLQREYARVTLEEALARCVARDPAAVQQLSKLVRKLNPTLLPLLARGVGKTRGPVSAAFLAHLLGKSAELDVIAMTELARVTDSSGIALPESALVDLRRLMDHADPTVQRTAIAVLGRGCDRESFDSLVRLLGSPNRLVSTASGWSLRNMARADLGMLPGPWLDWREGQDTWWRETFPRLEEQLRSEQPAAVFGALKELSDRPFFKHDVANAIGPLAADSQISVALPAIAALERIGSTQATGWLIQALAVDEERRMPAAKALRNLTGLDLPAEHLDWSRALLDSDAGR